MTIDSLESVRLNGTDQWIRVRGADEANPVLLLMQQGPGLPIINEARDFERRLGLERDFTVVYWDQRGTGLSARAASGGMSVANAVEDTVSLLELLRDRFGRKTVVAGFSFGATFSVYAAQHRPDLVAGLMATGMDVDIPFAEQHTYDFVLRTAKERGNRRALRQLVEIGPPPHLDTRRFGTQARWAANYGGVTAGATHNQLVRSMVGSLLRSRDYGVADVVRTVRGITATQAALLPELAGTDLVRTVPHLEVPIVLAQGRLDQVAPGEPAERFHASVSAPAKKLVWFERSAHTPQYDEPRAFRDLLMTLREPLTCTAG